MKSDAIRIDAIRIDAMRSDPASATALARPAAPPLLAVEAIAKRFTLHLQGGVELPVVSGVSFEVDAGECVALGGPSGAGKSSILKMVYGNYRTDSGRILVADGGPRVDVAAADPRQLLRLRAPAPRPVRRRRRGAARPPPRARRPAGSPAGTG